ncbi:unnamed protein product [Lota lota]
MLQILLQETNQLVLEVQPEQVSQASASVETVSDITSQFSVNTIADPVDPEVPTDFPWDDEFQSNSVGAVSSMPETW